jgi:hypothetical protein
MKKIAILLTTLVCAGSLMAADSPMKPGKWAVTTQMDIPNMPIKMPPITVSVCITEEDLKNPEGNVPKQDKDCKIGDYSVDGNTVTWTVSCPKQKMTGKGTITHGDDSYSGSMEMNMDGQTMKTKYSGKRQGDCKK